VAFLPWPLESHSPGQEDLCCYGNGKHMNVITISSTKNLQGLLFFKCFSIYSKASKNKK